MRGKKDRQESWIIVTGAWPVWIGRGGVEASFGEGVLEGVESSLLFWAEMVKMACCDVWVDGLCGCWAVCAVGEEERHGRDEQSRRGRGASPGRDRQPGPQSIVSGVSSRDKRLSMVQYEY